MPSVGDWSIGFVYHDSASGEGTGTLTYLRQYASGNLFAFHLARRAGVDVHNPPGERIARDVLKSGRGELNELVFRTSASGSFLRLNDEIVLEVSPEQLIRRSGWSRVCVGFNGDENEAYSIRYEDLRTRFDREGWSGVMAVSADDLDDGFIECPNDRWQNGYIAGSAIDSWVLMDVTFPSVEEWSFGLVYHNIRKFDSRTLIEVNSSSRYASHSTYRDGEFDHGEENYLAAANFKGGRNIVEFETTASGSWLRLNGEKILDVSASDLTRRIGSTLLCLGLIANEDDPYTISYSNLWAWMD